jgi:hypothetical protein
MTNPQRYATATSSAVIGAVPPSCRLNWGSLSVHQPVPPTCLLVTGPEGSEWWGDLMPDLGLKCFLFGRAYAACTRSPSPSSGHCSTDTADPAPASERHRSRDATRARPAVVRYGHSLGPVDYGFRGFDAVCRALASLAPGRADRC